MLSPKFTTGQAAISGKTWLPGAHHGVGHIHRQAY